MGRPKVDPANRLRANTACTACRASKKRCSGSFPCTNCIQKGRARTCIPFKSAGTDSRIQRHREKSSLWEAASDELLQSPLSSGIQDPRSPVQAHDRQLHLGSRSPEATHRTHPRMLRNLQGDQGKEHSKYVRAYGLTCNSLCWQGCFAVFFTTCSGDSDSVYWTVAVFPSAWQGGYVRDRSHP